MIVVIIIIMKHDHILPLFRIGHFVFLGIGSGYLSLPLSCSNTLSFFSTLLQSMCIDPQLSNFNFTQHVSLLILFFPAIQAQWCCKISPLYDHVVCSSTSYLESTRQLLGLSGGRLWCHVSGDCHHDSIATLLW